MSKHALNRLALVIGIVGPFAVFGPMLDIVKPRGPDMELAYLTMGAWMVYFWTKPFKPSKPPAPRPDDPPATQSYGACPMCGASIVSPGTCTECGEAVVNPHAANPSPSSESN